MAVDLVRVDTPANIGGSSQQDEEGFDIKNRVEFTSEDDDLMGTEPGTTLTADAALGQILTGVSAESISEIENQDGQVDVSLDSVGGFLGENTQEPALLEFTKERVFNQASQVIEVDDSQGVVDRQAGQEDLGFIGGINMPFELGDDDGVDGVAFEIRAITLLLVRFIAILVIGSQALDPDQLDMSDLLFTFSGTFVGKDKLVI